MINQNHKASFRDPSGYVFKEKGIIRRRINPIYFKIYHSLKSSGFYDKLFSNRLLIEHKELSITDNEIIIEPHQIDFISFPFEWCFNQYKEAALLTLRLQKYCLENDFSLKDASAFNVTFHKGKAVFIDTLSFGFYIKNKPWRAYRQFIMHFLGPLILARYCGAESLKLMSTFMNGIPLRMITSMLPIKTKFNPILYTNVHLLAKFESKHNEQENNELAETKLSKEGQLKIIESLYDYIKNLTIKENTEWGDYYSKINYNDIAFRRKTDIINEWVKKLSAKTLVDIGGNDGTFVRSINQHIDMAIVSDIDNNAVSANYNILRKNKEEYMLPLVVDILNPSASIGLNNEERDSFLNRIKAFAPDVTLGLAVIHHITLSGNVPFKMSAEFFSKFSKYLILEFPKRGDSWVEKLLSTKQEFRNHFDFYNEENFEKSYSLYFELLDKTKIENSERIMYLLKNKG